MNRSPLLQVSQITAGILMACHLGGPAMAQQPFALENLALEDSPSEGSVPAASPAEATSPTPKLGEGLSSSRISRAQRHREPHGEPYRVGSFLLYPQLEAAVVHDDNVFYSDTDRKSDVAGVYTAALWAKSNWSRHALNIHASADAIRYLDYSQEDSDDYRFSMEGRHDLSPHRNVYGGFHFSRNHEDRESPDDRNGVTPTRYYQERYYVGYFDQPSRWSFRLAATALRLNYRDVDRRLDTGVITDINNDDRDRWQYTAGVRVGYELSAPLEVYGQVALDNRRYDALIDDNGLARDSDGQRYFFGIKYLVPETLKLDVFCGWLKQDYGESGTVEKPILGFAMVWSASTRNTVTVMVDRTLEETTVLSSDNLTAATSYLNNSASIRFQHQWSEQWGFRIGASASRSDYRGIDREDDYTGAYIGAHYRLHPNALLEFEFSERRLDSTLDSENFKKRIAMLKLVIPFSS
jgi:hypothetical protein